MALKLLLFTFALYVEDDIVVCTHAVVATGIAKIVVYAIIWKRVDDFRRQVGVCLFAQQHAITFDQLERHRLRQPMRLFLLEALRHSLLYCASLLVALTHLVAALTTMPLCIESAALLFVNIMLPLLCWHVTAVSVRSCYCSDAIVFGIETRMQSSKWYTYYDAGGHRRVHYQRQ